MRVVVDTSVLISAAIKSQTLPSIALYQAEQRGVLLKSHASEAELMDVIDRPYLARLISPDARDRMVRLMAMANLVTITERVAACRDPKDDKFLELAVNGHADLILTGDNDLLVLNPFRGIPIVAPAAFVQDAARR
jgi:putative PIN family toxin of toxin-antitoxin system